VAPLPDSLIVGHADIDADHRELYEHVEDFREALFSGAPDLEFMRSFLTFLNAFLVEHFRRENEFMVDTAYPALEKHRRAHMKLWHDMLDLTESCEKSGFDQTCVVRVSTLVLMWLDRHVAEHDRPLAIFLRAR
jgi:hemerythrin-like metal-binding protein